MDDGVLFIVECDDKKKGTCKRQFRFPITYGVYDSVILCLKDAKILKDNQKVLMKDPVTNVPNSLAIQRRGYFGFTNKTLIVTVRHRFTNIKGMDNTIRIELKIVKKKLILLKEQSSCLLK